MKNANTRFIRVLAMVLVVLMVVPAALVGCGSNKANNAAISEALAAAEAARKEAEEAKAAADAAAAEAAAKAAAEAQKALEEANKKAEEAIKAAEEAKKKAEEAEKQAAEAAKTTAAPATTAPVTTAPVAEDAKEVAEYAYKVLNDDKLDFIKAMYIYYYGMTEEEIESEAHKAPGYDWIPNGEYASDDLDAMAKLYGVAKLAITKATTVDYINSIVANFIAELAATPTYVERIIEKYEAIDFASNYDVIDVVKAYKYLADANLSEDAEKALAAYGEDEIDVLAAIDTEYYRYTGVAGAYADTAAVEKVLYTDMYNDADDIAEDVAALVGAENGDELDVADLGYAANVDKAVAAVIKSYAAWNNTYFVKAKDTELVNYYEAFRQAFVGAEYVVDYENDYLWDALTAFEVRATELLAAAVEYKEVFKSALTKVATYSAINYWKQADQVATVKAALEAWKTKYEFKDDEDGNPDANVLAIIGPDVVEGGELIELGTYNKYLNNALIIEYFVYLEKTASAVNVDDFLKAYNSDLDEEDDVVTFDYAKYGSAVASAIDWYFGKEKKVGTDTVRVNGFNSIVPSTVKGFEKLDDATYAVSALIGDPTADPVIAPNVNMAKIFDNLFDLDIAGEDKTVFASMKTAYEQLVAKKKAADLINKAIADALEKGVDIDALDDVKYFIGANVDAVLDPEDDDDLYVAVGGHIGTTWVTGDYIDAGDANFLKMIDWDGIEALYANYKASTAEIEKIAVKIALEYIAWQGRYIEDDGDIAFPTNVETPYIFEDLEPIEINIFSYDMIKEIVDTYEAIQDVDKGDTPVVVPAADDKTLNITLETVTDYCYDMLVYFYDIVDSLNKNLWAEIYKGYALLDKTAYKNMSALPHATRDNEWLRPTTVDTIYKFITTKYTVSNQYVIDGVKDLLDDATIYKGYSDIQFGTASKAIKYTVGTGEAAVEYIAKPVSLQYAIAIINPNTYAIKNSSGTITGFDKAAYKAAVDKSIDSTYKQYLISYAKGGSDTAANLTEIVKIISTETLNTGLWNFADDIAIYGDIYDFSVNVDSTGKAWQLVVTDVDEDVVGTAKAGECVDIEVKYDGDDYTVRLTPELVDGKFTVTPALVLEEDQEVEFTVYDLLDDIDADDVDALVYDVRDYVDAIVANLDKVTNIPLLGNAKATLETFTADQINSMFAMEAKSDFWVEFNQIKGRMYASSTESAAALVYGDYVKKNTGTLAITDLDGAVQGKIMAASMIVYEKVVGMTPENTTIEEVIKIFNSFKNNVKNILSENGYVVTVVDPAAAYEQITITVPSAE